MEETPAKQPRVRWTPEETKYFIECVKEMKREEGNIVWDEFMDRFHFDKTREQCYVVDHWVFHCRIVIKI